VGRTSSLRRWSARSPALWAALTEQGRGLRCVRRHDDGAVAERDSIVGLVPNLAARIQQAADPGTVVISDVTQQLVDADFFLHSLGERHGLRRYAQGWDLGAVRHDYAVFREVLADAVRADARAGGADAEAALGILLGFVEQSETGAVAAWNAARAADADPGAADPTGHGETETADRASGHALP